MLAPGARLGPYEIQSLLGSGAMGEVYRARDPRLGREVAIKVLPAEWSDNPERLRRFEQEARNVAAISHPNILAVYDVGTNEGAPYIVSELLVGESLRARLAPGGASDETKPGPQEALPVRKALEYAIQIAYGLSAAHEKAVTHRDLKPENIFITSDDRAKILDFGLAKLTRDEPAADAVSTVNTYDVSRLPTATGVGMVLGTVGYMAPEQARGLPANHRADIFAFGAILYEMVSGRRAFTGDTPVDILTAILKDEPPLLSTSDRPVPPGLVRIVARCLEKSPAGRFQSTRDLAFALEGLASGIEPPPLAAQPVASAAARGRSWMAVSGFLLLTTFGLAAALYIRTTGTSAVPPMRLEVTTPPTGNPASLAVSPDGRVVIFAAASDGRTRLWLRSLDAVAPRLLAGTDGASHPFWSPDGRSIGFFADARLKRVEAGGGAVQTLVPADAAGGSWNRDGVILFAAGGSGGVIYRVPATGGAAVAVTRSDARQTTHRAPRFLPDGRHFLYFAAAGSERGVYVGALDAQESRRLLEADAGAAYAPPGFLLFAREGTLFAQRFDADRQELSGTPVQIAQQIAASGSVTAVDGNANGVLAYRTQPPPGHRQLVWFDRSGKTIGALSDPDDASPANPELSPDDRQVALDRSVDGNRDVWIIDTARGVATRLTFDPANDSAPIWSPDGLRIAFRSSRKAGGVQDLYQKLASGAGSDELLFASPLSKGSEDWSPDGRFVLFRAIDPRTGRDLWALPLQGDRQPIPVVQTEFEERDGQFSPDGRWIAYTSNQSGRVEVYVQPFPGPGGKWQISTAGGIEPRWRHDGRELFYMAPDGALMATAIKPEGQAVEAGKPVVLFTPRILEMNPGDKQQYAVARDGQRFLINVTGETAAAPIVVIPNWTSVFTGP